MIDKSGQEYTPPPVTFKAFKGEGQTLGGAGSSSAAPPPAVDAGAGSEPVTPTVDESKPKTRIQVQLHDGKKIQAEFNTDATVGDVQAWVASHTPCAAFVLANTYPRKVLEDFTQSIADAGLQGAALRQSLQ